MFSQASPTSTQANALFLINTSRAFHTVIAKGADALVWATPVATVLFE